MQAFQLAQHRRAQLLKASERQLNLRLNSRYTRNAHASRRLDRMLQQRGLADPWLPAHHGHTAASSPRRVEKLAERRALRETT
jgi:hypothetical protein